MNDSVQSQIGYGAECQKGKGRTLRGRPVPINPYQVPAEQRLLCSDTFHSAEGEQCNVVTETVLPL